MRTQVAIIGAGPAGLLLSHLLAQRGIESIVVETRSRTHVESRIRAGILESATVDLLDSVGLGERLHREGTRHSGIHLRWPEEHHHLDFEALIGRNVWIYGQTELQRDLGLARDADAQQIEYCATDVSLHDLTTAKPFVTFTDADGRQRQVHAEAIAGCDGSFGPSRAAIPRPKRWEHTYPYSWLGILADVAPSTDELIYAYHPEGFALHSMRSATVSRMYLQVPNATVIEHWPDERIWDALATRLGHGHDGWHLQAGPITAKSVLPMRSFVQEPMRHGRLFLAGDAGHIVAPTGAKGLNLAVADVALLAPALSALIGDNNPAPADRYSEQVLRRVWRCTQFSWRMTTMLHTSDDPFHTQLQLAELRWVTANEAAATELAENYAGVALEH